MLGTRADVFARWGLLATTLAMGTALMVTSLVSYIGVRGASASLIRARGMDLTVALHHSMRLMPTLGEAALAEIASDLTSQGVRYLAILGPNGTPIASTGTPTIALAEMRLPQGRLGGPPGPHIEWRSSGEMIQVVATIPGPGGHRMMNPMRLIDRDIPSYVAFEFVPDVATEMRSRALATLAVSSAAAILLAAVALISWNKSRDAERLAAALARDQHLKSLGRMSAVLSHELRNPLAALKGHAQLLLERLEPGHAGRAGAEHVIREARRLETLANQILDFARLGTITRACESPEAVARAAVDAVGCADVRLTVAPGITAWELDRVRIEQVLVNLIRNAVQASHPGSPIEVALECEDRQLVFSVRDFGPGLPPGDETRVFEPFYTGWVQGTGLGLAIAKQIVEAHGGRIDGSTHTQGGALFRVVLPLPSRTAMS
jgi:signal transduction histidine kinase